MTQATDPQANPFTTPPLAIIGIGCLFPRAADSTAYWAVIREGVDAISDIPASHWRVQDYYNQDPKSADMTYGRRGGFLADVPFNPMEYNIPPATLEAIDSSQLLGLVAAGQALKDAGYGAERSYDRDRVSVILGVTGTLELVIPLGARLGHPHWRAALKDAGVDDATAEDVVQRIADAYVPWQENSFPGLLGNVVAGRISKQFDLGGTNCVVDAACASSLSALHLAALELATGKSDMVVTGGIDTFNDIFMYMCFSKTPALSPTGDAKPFDAAGDGTILGEGLGIVVVKRLADAERDGDRIYAVIRGIGSSSDGKGEAIYTPSAAGQKKAILDAYQRAGVTPDSIGLVEAHGTGTKVGDAVEVSALREIYGEAGQPWCALGSVKSQIGHTKAAAGAAGLIKAALALHHKVIPPTIKVRQPLREVSAGASPFYLTDRKRPWLAKGGHPRRAAVSALGFGGSNFHVVLEEYTRAAAAADWDGSVQLLAFSAADAGTLAAAVSAVAERSDWTEIRTLAATQRAAFDPSAPCRLVLVVEQGKTVLPALCGNALAMLRKEPAASWSTPDGAWYAVGTVPGQMGLLFPGQGAQYTGMLRDLACAFPQVQASLDAADQGFADGDGVRLSDLIYPPTAFSDEALAAQEAALRATDVAQPAIGAVSLGALRVLESFGVTAAATAGHSYGELTALCAAKRLDESSFHALSRLRGQLMAAGDGDKGSMLAISAPLAAVQQLLADEQLDLVIANRNAPSQAVLSGSSAGIARAAELCTARKLACKRLPVAAAFHSPLVADAAAPLLAALVETPIHDGILPVYANSTAACYPADADEARQLLAAQLARPVEFVAEIEAMYAAGIRTFVEVGPGGRLTGLVTAILADCPHAAVALDASAGRRSGLVDLARCLAQLAVLGYPVALTRWDEGYTPAPATSGKKPALIVNINGANYVKPREKRPAAPSRPSTSTSTSTSTLASSCGTATTAPELLAESLRVTREGMTVLMRMQDETAQLHRRFLEGQETAGKTIQLLLDQQQRILQGGSATSLSAGDPAGRPYGPLPTVAFANVPPAASPTPAGAGLEPAPTIPVDTVTETLLAVVSEKTGYPAEMLELEMGLDSDLGIDSIKRVEILSALQERLPGSPVIGPEHLGTLHTLGEIARHLGAGAASASPAGAGLEPAPTPCAVPCHGAAASPGVPVNRSTIVPLPLPAGEGALKLSDKGAIWITRDGSALSAELQTLLNAAGHTARLVDIQDAFMDVPAELAGLVICTPVSGVDDTFFENAFLLMKSAGPALRRAGENGGALFATVSHLDGTFGCGSGTTLVDPLSGGLAGLAKTAACEWSEVSCKAIDTGLFNDVVAEAQALADELLLAGPLEVGLTPAGRTTLKVIDLPALTLPTSAPLQAGEVVVMTGGGRGVTAAAAIALAAACQPRLVLLGRSLEPRPEPEWLAGVLGESQIKRAILEQSPQKLHPREIEERYQAIIAGRELTATLAKIAELGGRALYRSVDIRDARAVAGLLDEIRREFGPIRGIVHGAGVLADQLISDKTLEQFSLVYGTKVAGLRALLAATAEDDLRFMALFSSTSGRLGRRGQVDYAVANEVLNKLAQLEARRRPACRTVSLNWGPWDGGMVTPALKKLFADEGVGLIGMKEGGELLLREIAATGDPVEVIALACPSAESLAVRLPPPAKPLTEAFGLHLSVDEYPFLRAHVIDGKAVLPVAMIVEWLAHGALHGNPGFRFHGFNDLRVCKGVVFAQGVSCALTVMAGRAEKDDSLYAVPVELVGANGTLHARAEILLTNKFPQGIRSIVQPPATTPYPGPVYAPERLFHGELLQGIEKIDGCSPAGIAASVKGAPKPEQWIRRPLRNFWLTDPLVIDCAFQMMILWSFERSGCGSLPTFAGRYRQFQECFPSDGAQVLVKVTAERPHSACADIEFLEKGSGKLIARLEHYECIIDASLQQAFLRNQLPPAESVALKAG